MIAQIARACEGAKRVLSASQRASVQVESLHEGVDFSLSVNRARFEGVCGDLFRRAAGPVAQALAGAGADADVVVGLYEQGFVRAFDAYRQDASHCNVYYEHLGWGTAQVPTLVAALEYAEAHCRPKDAEGKEDAKLKLWLGGGEEAQLRAIGASLGNKFTAAEEAQLRAALPEGSTTFALRLSEGVHARPAW